MYAVEYCIALQSWRFIKIEYLQIYMYTYMIWNNMFFEFVEYFQCTLVRNKYIYNINGTLHGNVYHVIYHLEMA